MPRNIFEREWLDGKATDRDISMREITEETLTSRGPKLCKRCKTVNPCSSLACSGCNQDLDDPANFKERIDLAYLFNPDDY